MQTALTLNCGTVIFLCLGDISYLQLQTDVSGRKKAATFVVASIPQRFLPQCHLLAESESKQEVEVGRLLTSKAACC